MTVPDPLALATLTQHLTRVLNPAWLEPAYAQRWHPDNPTFGFCAIAAEAAFFVLGGAPAGWMAWATRDDDGSSHWWLQHASGTRYDPTAEQFTAVQRVPPYARGLLGRPCGFMGMRQDPDSPWGFGRKPSRRAEAVLRALGDALDVPGPWNGATIAQLRDAITQPRFDDVPSFERWAAQAGVTVEVLAHPSAPETPWELAWIERHPSAPAGTGRGVLEALLTWADQAQRPVELVCVAGVLESWYRQMGFAPDEAARDPETHDVPMHRPVGGAPAPVVRRRPKW